MPKPKLIIDGDIPLYAVAFSVEEPINWGNDFWTLHADMGEARDSLQIWVDKLCDALSTTNLVIALSDRRNWRKEELAEDYKANRANSRKPVVYNPLKDFIRQRWETVEYPRLEADDILGIMSNSRDIMVSSDKDLLTVPGKHLNPEKLEQGVVGVTKEQAYYHHMTQTLVGDSTDNYKGCPGVGPVAAKKLLDGLSPSEMWPAVVARYAKSKLSEDHALTQARLAHILLPGEYDCRSQEVSLWNPPE